MFKIWKYLFATQFLGVFNDNLLKSLICFVSVTWMAEGDPSVVISTASALLVAPFILFSPLAGKLSVTKSKLKIVRVAKFLEIPIMFLALIGFYFERLELVMTALFFMGLQSTMFSPSKYGLIRDIGGVRGLSYGSGSMEMLGFVGVLLGTVLAGFISDVKEYRTIIIGMALLFTALLGYLSSRGIKAKEPQTDLNFKGSIDPFSFLWKNYKWSNGIKGLNNTVLGLATFWLIGAMVQMNLIVFCPGELGLTNTETSIVIAFVAIGIGFGCYVSGLLARKKVELGLVPIGGLGLSVCMTLIASMELSTKWFIVALLLGSFFSGLYKVPLTAWLQERVEGRKVGDILAYNNLVVFVFILISSGIFALVESKFGSRAVFTTIAMFSWIITLITLYKIPAMLVRFIAYILGHTFFKISLKGSEHIPERSGALIVANHISLLDALLVVAAVPRMVRFVAHKKVFDHPLLNWWMRRLNVIPILPKGGSDSLKEFTKICQDEINAGHVVCIFPEGQISRSGHLDEFKKGLEYIGKGIDAPIIPLYFDNVVGSPFSYYTGSSALFKLRRSTLKRKVSIAIGEGLPSDTPSFNVRQKMLELSSEVFGNRIQDHQSLSYFFIKTARSHPYKALTWEKGHKISYGDALKEVLGLTRILQPKLEKYRVIGLDITSSYQKVIYNLALNLLGKVVVNVDEKSPVKNSALEPSLDAIICKESHSEIYTNNLPMFLEEDIIFQPKSIGFNSPRSIVQKYTGKVSSEHAACIIFDQKEDGFNEIRLTNKNILCNILGLKQVHKIDENDAVLSMLPLSTSLGFTGNLWLPLCLGLSIYFPASLKNSEMNATIVIGWEEDLDVLIQHHLSRSALKTIQHVITGHPLIPEEKEEWIRKNWHAEIRYGFGMPEASPIVSVNSPDYELTDLTGESTVIRGNQEGSVGRPLPGVAIRIVDPDNMQDKDADEEGMLMIKGPNVIRQEQSKKALTYKGDWLLCGVKGRLDERGFLFLSAPSRIQS